MIRLLTLAGIATLSSAFYPPHSAVIELTTSNFEKLVLQSNEIWMVEFYAPWCGYSKALIPDYMEAADVLMGVVKVGAVDAYEHSDLAGTYGVTGHPVIKFFGANKNKPEDFNGNKNARGLVDAAMLVTATKVRARIGRTKSTSSNAVIELTADNFDELVLQSEDMWLVEFFAPWCGHCKKFAPDWAKAATELAGKVKLGALDAAAHHVLAEKYGVQGYPTIKLFASGKKTSSSVSDYNGGRSPSDIVTWALEKFVENVPASDVAQIVDKNTFTEACLYEPLCVVAILPHILDCPSECRNGYLQMLKGMSEKHKKRMWGWLWSEAGAQHDLESSLDIGGFGYPAMAVINARKMMYSALRGAFSKEGIDEFLRNLSHRRGNSSPVRGQKLPEIVRIEAWDGKDGEFILQEEYGVQDEL